MPTLHRTGAAFAAMITTLVLGGFICVDPGPVDMPSSLDLSTEPGPAYRPPEPPRRPPTLEYLTLARMSELEIRQLPRPIVIPMLTYGGEKFPFPNDQFTLSKPDKCKTDHYHAEVGYTLQLKKVKQPEDPCGWGNSVADEEADIERLIEWFRQGPKAQHL